MRDRYLDSPTATPAHARVRELCPRSVGIRSLSEEEAEHLEDHPVPMWSVRQLRALKGEFRPVLEASPTRCSSPSTSTRSSSIMPRPARPNPRPRWYRRGSAQAVAGRARIVGFDVVELADRGPGRLRLLAARLTYRLIVSRWRAFRSPRGLKRHHGLTAARLVLRKNQDRRVRSGHPWVFSNEVAQIEGEPPTGPRSRS